jgi:hypothetical protein
MIVADGGVSVMRGCSFKLSAMAEFFFWVNFGVDDKIFFCDYLNNNTFLVYFYQL